MIIIKDVQRLNRGRIRTAHIRGIARALHPVYPQGFALPLGRDLPINNTKYSKKEITAAYPGFNTLFDRSAVAL
jgi:hypothetical protein